MADDQSPLAAQLGPIVSLIPQPVRDEIASVCAVIALLAGSLATALLATDRAAAAGVVGAVGGFATGLGALLTRQSVTKTSAVAVDSREITGPVVVTKTQPSYDTDPRLGIVTPPQPTVQITPIAPGAATVITTDPVTGEVSTSELPIAGSPEDDVPPLDPDALDA